MLNAGYMIGFVSQWQLTHTEHGAVKLRPHFMTSHSADNQDSLNKITSSLQFLLQNEYHPSGSKCQSHTL